jgi:glyoxylase I family protein
MKINGIHHVAVICSNFEISKDFYTNILGFEPIDETYRENKNSYKLDLEISGKYQIELFSFPSPPQRLSFPEATGLRHLAFEVDDIYEAHNCLTSKGIIVENIQQDELSQKKFFFFRDPDDLPLEIYEK